MDEVKDAVEQENDSGVKQLFIWVNVNFWGHYFTSPCSSEPRDVLAVCQTKESLTHVNRKWAFFSFNKSWRYHICIAECHARQPEVSLFLFQ